MISIFSLPEQPRICRQLSAPAILLQYNYFYPAMAHFDCSRPAAWMLSIKKYPFRLLKKVHYNQQQYHPSSPCCKGNLKSYAAKKCRSQKNQVTGIHCHLSLFHKYQVLIKKQCRGLLRDISAIDFK
jgi:hypothetical protein